MGIRKWYELQWGRDEELSKNKKIVFPYKANENKFTIVKEEVCSSADIYFLTIKDQKKDRVSLEYLVAFLNSNICEFYFKCIGKKLNDKLYEYYPNKLETLRIKFDVDIKHIEELVKMIESSYIQEDYKQIDNLKKDINKCFYKIYGLTKDEIELVKSYN